MVSGFLLTFTNSTQAGVVIANGKVSQITGVVDNIGRTWNVSITYGVSFTSIFGSGDPPATKVPAFWGDYTGATAVSTDMFTQLYNYGQTNENINHNFSFAYDRDSGDPSKVKVWRQLYSSSSPSPWGSPSDILLTETASTAVLGWAEFTQVPEPTSAALFAGIATVGLFRRRRQVSAA